MTRALPTSAETSAWPGIAALVRSGRVDVEVLPPGPDCVRLALESLRVDVSSYLGAVSGHCGGLMVDHGWLRVLGAGGPGLLSVRQATEAFADVDFLVVALDALGGIFAVNQGGLVAALGEVCYFGPDSTTWFATRLGYSDFITWALSGHAQDFFDELRWPRWQDEVTALHWDQGLAVEPAEWTPAGLAAATRTPAPLADLVRRRAGSG